MRSDLRRIILPAILFVSLIQLPLFGQLRTDSPSQDFTELVVRAYGQDQELVNGLQYYNRNPRAMGHPYLLEGWVHQGSVRIRGKLYPDVWLKFDIHEQQVEVEYRTMNGADNQVILVGDRLDEFTIREQYFRKLQLNGEPEKIYQVIGDGRMILYIGWRKKLVPVSGDSRFIEEFSPPKRTYYLELDGSVSPFSNKKSFVVLFPKEIQKDMRRLIKSNHLLIRTASVKELELFLMAAKRLLEDSPG
jgi:hypothetical protein